MSKDFIKMVSEIPSQRYVMQINNLIANKIPCGIFYGLDDTTTAAENIAALKNAGLNITALCVIGDFDKGKMGGGVIYLA